MISLIKMEIHEKALSLSRKYRECEVELMGCLSEIDSQKIFLAMGYASLFRYCCEALGLSESQSYALISVTRKSRDIPELRASIEEGKIPLFKASRIVSVINPENKEEWLGKASSLSKRELEKAVVQQNPRELVKERIKAVTEEKRILTLVIGKKEEESFRRIQELLSQKLKKHVTLEEAFSILTEEFIDRRDPLKRAERNVHKEAKSTLPGQRRASAKASYEVHLRDNCQCTYIEPSGKRCPQRKWLQIHHQMPFAKGGHSTKENLTTLCFNHHTLMHASDRLRIRR